MFVLDSGTNLQGTGGAEVGTWVAVEAGPDGGPAYKQLLKVEQWKEWDYKEGEQP